MSLIKRQRMLKLTVIQFLLLPLYAGIEEGRKAGEVVIKEAAASLKAKVQTPERFLTEQQLLPKDLLPPEVGQKGKARSRPFNPQTAKDQVEALPEGGPITHEVASFLLSEKVQENTDQFKQGSGAERDGGGPAYFEEIERAASEIHAQPLLSLKAHQGRGAATEGGASASTDPSATIEVRCQEEGVPYRLKVHRKLNVEVTHTPARYETVKICKGHQERGEKYKWFYSWAHKKAAEMRREIERDPSIEWASSRCHVGPNYRQPEVCYKHKENHPLCEDFEQVQREVTPAVFTESDGTWAFEDSGKAVAEIVKGPTCGLISQVCVDKAPKYLNGKWVHRPCWEEALVFQCQHPPQPGCQQLTGKGCRLKQQRCLKPSLGGGAAGSSEGIGQAGQGCALWEKTFLCPRKKLPQGVSIETADGTPLYCLDGACGQREVGENQSFPEVATKLAVFGAMKEEMEAGGVRDLTQQTTVFAGRALRCKKNVLENVMYDCCGTREGFFEAVGLAACNEEEQTLMKQRPKGNCHFVGTHEDRFLFWHSSTFHTFCCYPSKLIRVLQEEAHKQLKLSWGTSSAPRCSGLSMEEIARLDFERMDLREAFSEVLAQTSPEDPREMTQHVKGETPHQRTQLRQRLQERVNRTKLSRNEGGLKKGGVR